MMSPTEMARRLFGRVVNIERRKVEQPVRTGSGVNKASSWWEADAYTGTLRQEIYRIAGVPVFKRTNQETIWGVYAVPAHDTVAVIEEIISAGLLSPLERRSRVFEGGCNVGRNLRALVDRYGCSVTGIDISKKAVALANTRMFSGHAASITVGDLLDERTLAQFPDKHFDLALTRWNLIHIPAGPEKTRYIDHMKRIAKSVVIMEPTIEGRRGVELFSDGAYALSWDDWTSYGFSEFKPRNRLPDKTCVYVSR